ncbi:16S rRNA (guanine(527)-N(7))-methyltransferase RsmG [Paratissierella segnis]|uniref:Ribosomal RNA small subunit methyltransferase G n=1 Tax=Paratissierella segnis TaxID=2763679 RepID=A0A926EUA1_9FIRM|nr:16S rRNA (guanine(527)-N(7))-methyltransferase RsmG [Paratissierella segnis]MBC8586717.1 16S rRNA (guanine(527)-N(7))-methyltransferase RsmG [Paratissierella segnis]
MSDILIKGAEELNISIEEKDINSFEIYKEMLKEWNTKINITTITDDEDIDIKHFLDSLTPLVTNLFDGKKNLIDIGTGGGFPGIPLKIIKRELNVTLLDSLNKRINFLNEVINRLELEDIIAIHARAEEMSIKPVYREKYDIAISRAVASLNTLSEYCIPFVKLGGYFISMKGPDAEEELKSGNNAIKVLGGRIVDKKLICIPESDIMHSLIIIEKIKETPTKYPRGGGKPRKNPL